MVVMDLIRDLALINPNNDKRLREQRSEAQVLLEIVVAAFTQPIILAFNEARREEVWIILHIHEFCPTTPAMVVVSDVTPESRPCQNRSLKDFT